MAGTYSYRVESYAQIMNLDRSVLKLNPVLEPIGYKFVRISLQELEKNFSDLFGFPTNFKSENICTISHYDGPMPSAGRSIREVIERDREEKIAKGIPIEEIETTISGEFQELVLHTFFGGHELIQEREMIFLKRIEDFDHEIIDGATDFVLPIKVQKEMEAFVRPLVQRLRLFKNGDVILKIQFQIAADTRKVIQRYNPRFSPGGMRKFIVTDEDVALFTEKMTSQVEANVLCEFALSNFNLSYEIPEIRAKYLTLMTCLESLFNLGPGEVSHTISRHLSLLISKDQSEFENNYRRLKKLYHNRNLIIHGSKPDEDILTITEELQNYCRNAINHCMEIRITKKELFTLLNKKGI